MTKDELVNGGDRHLGSGECADGEVDILGIGFGPSNLSLAIAIEELNERRPAGRRLTARFVDARRQFGWHDGMLLPGATMQISFLKDLVSPRTPTSSFTFLNYLHEQGRVSDFINLKTFFPTRREFHGYLSWAASRIDLPVSYGTRATRIDWSGGRFEVTLESVVDGSEVTKVAARHVVIGSGSRPVLPEGIEPGPRVFHNHQLLNRLAELPSRTNGRFLVVGSGQSAAEVAAYLHDSYPDAEVHASFRRYGYTRPTTRPTPTASSIRRRLTSSTRHRRSSSSNCWTITGRPTTPPSMPTSSRISTGVSTTKARVVCVG